jgi:putative nucleotidyltransferase with HDIG domain
VREQIPRGWGGVCIPIRDEQQPLGVLLIAVPSEWQLSKNEIRLLSTLAEMIGSVLHRMRLHEQTEQRLQNIAALSAIDKAISSSLDIQFILNVALEQTTKRLGVDAAVVLLLDAHQHILEYGAGRGFRSEVADIFGTRLGEGQAGRAALEQRTIAIPNLSKSADPLVYTDFLQREQFMAYYSVPLISKGKVSGVLEIFHRKPLNPNPEWLDFLETLAGQVAIALDGATLFNDLQRSNFDLALAYDATIEGWSHALDLRDKETEGHTQRVTEMTMNLATAMNINKTELVHIRRGALLHDIGKMGIPDAILLKPGSLTDEEWEIMRKHPVYAYEMLSLIKYLNNALEIPYCHHEKWDGSGYPRGLKGEEIPPAARIFSLADVYDALTSDRPYRKAWSKQQALDHIQAGSGTHFDPLMVEAFLGMLSKDEQLA